MDFLDLDFYITDKNENLVEDKNYFILYDENVSNKKFLFKHAQGKDVQYVFFSLKDYASSLKDIKKSLLYLQRSHIISSDCEFYLTYKTTLDLLEHEESAVKELNEFILNKFNTELKVPNMYFYMLKNPIILLEDSWSIEKPLAANKILNNVAAQINTQNYSSYEKFLAAYTWVTSFTYKAENSDESALLSRNLFEVLNGDKIVCYGFAAILKALCERVGVPAMMEDVTVIEEEIPNELSVSKHSRLIVKMVDAKYGLDGIYYSDPTQDSFRRQDGFDNKFLLFHLVPFDIKLYDHIGKLNSILQDDKYNLSEKEEFSLARLLWGEGFTEQKVLDFVEFNSLKERYTKEMHQFKNKAEAAEKEKDKTCFYDLFHFKAEQLHVLENMRKDNVKLIKETMKQVKDTKAIDINVVNQAFKNVVPLVKPSYKNTAKFADYVTYQNLVRYNKLFKNTSFQTFYNNYEGIINRMKAYKKQEPDLSKLNFITPEKEKTVN